LATDTMTPEKYRELLAKGMSEEELAAQVIELARDRGWLVKRDPTWRATCATPGYPDLTMVRKGRVVWAELKREGKEPTDAQKVWLDALRATGHGCYVWRPSSWLDGTIEEILR